MIIGDNYLFISIESIKFIFIEIRMQRNIFIIMKDMYLFYLKFRKHDIYCLHI